ncbi:DNA-binding protein [candidate division LCP-89 bacterium B3_LCP]|uniref:DNA-binding protein n=1 Tax=candidate division LCP-89 bacterium B3_LCP TaxID=2012998 RepID=A0A532V3G1_UNCL8|nr:MAG: DNA-binding protein [candidate division LCP-89 bacterium B3_LCP]
MPEIDPKLVEIVQQWFKKGSQDLWMAKTALDREDAPGDLVAFHAQQAVEKCIKGLLTLHQIEFPKTHDLHTLVELLRPFWSDIPASVENSDELTDFAVMTRYPHEFEDISLKEAKKAFTAAEDIFEECRNYLAKKGITILE